MLSEETRITLATILFWVYLYQDKNISCCLFFVFSAVKMESDLFDLQSTFQPSMQPGSTGLPVATAWAGKESPPPPTPLTNICSLDFGDLFCMLSFSGCCLTLMPTSSSPLFSVSLSSLSSACIDPFTSAEAGDDSMPNLNPFLSKLVVDATHLPVVSSDGVSFPSRTSGHEMFGGNDSFCFSSVSSLLFISL